MGVGNVTEPSDAAKLHIRSSTLLTMSHPLNIVPMLNEDACANSESPRFARIFSHGLKAPYQRAHARDTGSTGANIADGTTPARGHWLGLGATPPELPDVEPWCCVGGGDGV
jgi:hypothetical protein